MGEFKTLLSPVHKAILTTNKQQNSTVSYICPVYKERKIANCEQASNMGTSVSAPDCG